MYDRHFSDWDQFDAAGDMSDDEEDEEDEEEDVPLAIDTNVSDDDYVGAPNDDKDANDTNSFGEYDGYVFNDDHEEEEDEQDEEQEEDDESDNDDDELAAIELAIAAGPNPPENGPGARGEGDLPLEALFLSRLSLSRIAASALLMPALSALAGRGLLVLAQRWSPSLARFLGVRYAGGGGGRGGLVMGAAFWGGVRGFALGGGGGGGGVDGLDPVWWRNTVGAGLIVLLRDAFSLLYVSFLQSLRNPPPPPTPPPFVPCAVADCSTLGDTQAQVPQDPESADAQDRRAEL